MAQRAENCKNLKPPSLKDKIKIYNVGGQQYINITVENKRVQINNYPVKQFKLRTQSALKHLKSNALFQVRGIIKDRSIYQA
jgi:hypothetical protein